MSKRLLTTQSRLLQVEYLHTKCWTESTYYLVAREFPHWTNPELDEDSRDFLKNLEKFRNMPYYRKEGLYISGPSGKQGPAGQRWVISRIKQIKHFQHIKHFNQI